jgi:hypothetical protein
MENYEPELGQSLFGQPYKELGVNGNVENALRTIRGLMESKSKTGYTPFDNSGERFNNGVFECNAYDWSECNCEGSWDNGWTEESCTCGWEPQLYNFKWRDFEVSWYKYLGRGMSMNREIGGEELSSMLSECMKSLL